jgi:hypothetical protein
MKVKITKSNKAVHTKSVLTKLENLYQAGIEWNAQFARTNLNLYMLLAECLGIFHEIKGNNIEGEVIKTMSTALIASGFKVPKHPRVINLIVRYVFNTERRRVFSYARALNIAINEGVTVSAFSQWVDQQGGVEEVTATKGKTEETIQREALLMVKIEEAQNLLANKLLKPLAVIGKDQFTERAGGGEYTLLIGKTTSNNKTQVLCTVPDVTAKMIDVAISKIATALIYDDKVNEANEVLSNKNKSINSAVLKMIEQRALAVGESVSKTKARSMPKSKGISLIKKKLVAAKHRTEAA